MVQCSRHVIPPAVKVDLTDQPAHDLGVGLEALRAIVLTAWRLGTILTRKSDDGRPPLALPARKR
jgi:hypothetical protein